VDTEQNDPRKIIFSFLSELPQTIQTEALLFVIIYAIGVDLPNDTKEFPGVVRDYLIRLGIPAIGAVICTAAVIDHIFEGQIPRLDSAEAALKLLTDRDPKNLAFQQSHLSLPLRRRHWEQAFEKWNALRATKLAPQNLRAFADNHLIPHVRRSE